MKLISLYTSDLNFSLKYRYSCICFFVFLVGLLLFFCCCFFFLAKTGQLAPQL